MPADDARNQMQLAFDEPSCDSLVGKPRKDAQVNLRIDRDTKGTLARAARSCRLSLSEYLIQCGLLAAGRVLAGRD